MLFSILKILSIIFGCIIGYLMGITSSTAGGPYDNGCSRVQLTYLCDNSVIFKIAEKIDVILIMFGTPFVFLILMVLGALWFCFSADTFIMFINTEAYVEIAGICLIIYLVFLLIFSLIGTLHGSHIQDKLNIYKIK